MGSGAAKGTSVKGLGTTAWGNGAASVRPGARAGRSRSSRQGLAPTVGAPGRTSGAEPSARAQSHGPGALLLSPADSLHPGEWGGLGCLWGTPRGPAGLRGRPRGPHSAADVEPESQRTGLTRCQVGCCYCQCCRVKSCPTLCDPIDGTQQASLSLGFSRQEHWSGLPFPSPMHESEK